MATIAPGEGKVPTDILQDTEWDMRAFPTLDPRGENNLNCKRDVKLSAQDFFQQRIMNVNSRFAKCSSFVFAAVQYIENKQLTGNINISFQRGKATEREDGGLSYTLDDACSVLDNIKNTPRFLKKKKNEFIAKLQNNGPFQFFFTLSCADTRYEENFTSVLQDHDITYEVKDGREHCLIDGDDLETFLKNNQSKHEFIRTNILTATRNFDHRVKQFIKTVIMSKFNPMCVEFYNYRVEFQMRGAAHIHGVLWLDLDMFVSKNPEFSGLKEAFDEIGKEGILNESQQKLLSKFADKFITCTLKDPSTKKIVEEVNVHHHTRTCRRCGKSDCNSDCRFFFPRYPVDETLVSIPAHIKYKDEEQRSEMVDKSKLILKKVKDILTDEEEMKILNKICRNEIDAYPNEDTLLSLQRKRLLALLVKSDINELLRLDMPESYNHFINHSEDEKPQFIQDFENKLLMGYKDMLRISTGGYKIIHKRDIDEIYVNNYNKEWIKCWDANMDIQITLDHFAIITYITDYMLKDDTGTMEFIKKAMKDAENKSLRERLKVVKNTFLTHRQIGEAEAYYKLFKSFKLSDSNCATLFVHAGFPNKRSRFLRNIPESQAKNVEKGKLITLENKPGQFYILAESLEDRYDDRPPVLEKITLSQFAKRCTLSSKTKNYNKDEDTDVDSDEETELNKMNSEEEIKSSGNDNDFCNGIKEDFIISFEKIYRKKLPKLFEARGRTMRLRRPLALRFHKFNQTKEPHQYYFSQLRLYHPHRPADLENWQTNEEACIIAYEKNKAAIQYVKSKVMKYQEKVDEAQIKAQEEFDSYIGDLIDSTKEQQEADCIDEGIQDIENTIAIDPDDYYKDRETNERSNVGYYKKIELNDLDYLCTETRTLDPDQRKVVDIGIQYSQNINKHLAIPSLMPKPPFVVVHGGAGCGKSFVINLMSQWQERIFRKSGDDPNKPYILKCAFTGTAASIIQGQTLHHAFSFSFGNDFYSLNDKTRDERRSILKNLKVLIIDEFSMVKSDMLYQLDLRLKEITERPNVPFGGISIFLFGDLLQLRPTAARFIFEEPCNEQFKLTHALGPLWDLFNVVNLTYNHRQGNDKIYADLLNRMRIGETTEDDIKVLSTRVMPKNDPKLPKDSIYLSSRNEDVNFVNELRLEDLSTKLLTINAAVLQSGMRNNKPKVDNTGMIRNTPLQHILKLKTGARIMLTYNINVSDGLTNGALGEFIGYDVSEEGRISRLYVHFFDEKAGKEKRRDCNHLQTRFPGKLATPIEKLEFTYSISKKAYSTSSSAKALQFPVKLAWAITAHKIQGQTIPKPRMLIVDMSSVFVAAQTYVMLSRVQELKQLIIIDSVKPEKIYTSNLAMDELHRMNLNAINSYRQSKSIEIRLMSINIRSLRKHFIDLLKEPEMENCDVILVQQTCLQKKENTLIYQNADYNCHFNSFGNGKGIAMYFKTETDLIMDINTEHYQMSKLQYSSYDIICVYRSSDSNKANQINFLKDLNSLISAKRKTLICGDFNFDILSKEINVIFNELSCWNFHQFVESATHIEGGLIDHCYMSDNIDSSLVTLKQKSVYYTDHDLILVNIKFRQ